MTNKYTYHPLIGSPLRNKLLPYIFTNKCILQRRLLQFLFFSKKWHHVISSYFRFKLSPLCSRRLKHHCLTFRSNFECILRFQYASTPINVIYNIQALWMYFFKYSPFISVCVKCNWFLYIITFYLDIKP